MANFNNVDGNRTLITNEAIIDESNISLVMGVESNNLDLIRCSLDKTIDPSNIQYNDNSTLLHFGVYQNNIEIVKTLLSCSKNINATDANGKTPLLIAVENNSEAYNKMQSLNYDTIDSMKSCEQFVKEGQQIIECLLDAGADTSIADVNGINPVFVTISKNNLPLIDCLLHRGLSKDPNSFAAILRDSLHLTARLNNKEVFQILMENYSINVDIENSMGVTPLQVAIEMGHADMVEYLLDNGANVQGLSQNNYIQKISELSINETIEKNSNKTSNENCLINEFLEPQKSTPSVIEWLMDTPPNSSTGSISEKENLTPIHVAVQHNRLEIAKILLFRGADPDATSSNCQYSPLLTAISREYSKMAELLLRSGADPNEMVNFMGMSSCYLLHCAVLKGNLDIVKMLVENGAKVNLYDRNGYSSLSLAIFLQLHHIIDYFLNIGAFINSSQSSVQPLHLAIAVNDLDTVQKLLHYGADIEATNENGKTALYLAVENDNINGVKFLLEAGANVNVEFKSDDTEVFTPLHMATINGNIQIAKMLLEYGAHSHPETSPIYLAIATGNIELFKIYWANRYLIEGPDSDSYWNDTNTAIHWAVSHDQVCMVKLLNGLCGNINLPDKEGYSPLFRAMLKQNNEIVMCLVKDGALVNNPCTANKYKQWMPIHLAAYSGNLAWVQLLIQNGASIHAITDNHMCPLWLAVKRGHFDIIKYLLEYRADVHCRNTSRYNNKNTPLHLAIKNKRIDIVKLLIQYKANVNYENESNHSPLSTAIRESDYAIAKYLLKKGAKIHSASIENHLSIPLMNIAVALNQKSLVQLLLQHGASVDDVDKEGRTPLAVAIERGHVKMVKYLLQHGADANVAYRLNGEIIIRTLFLAISGRHTQIVKELLKYPIDINAILNNEKYTPLLFAVYLGFTEIAEVLLNVDTIDLDAVDIYGMSALHQAVINGHKTLVGLLIEFGASVELKDMNGFTPLDYSKDDMVKKLHQLYLTKEHCLRLSNKELAIYIEDEVHDSALIDLIDLCLNELARLKKKSIAGITLYELLTMSNEQCALFYQEITKSQIKKLFRYLKSDKVKITYPNFVYMLRKKMLFLDNK